MPMPQEYQRATQIFDQILADICVELNLATRNQSYTVLQSVLLVFRRRLHTEQVLQFSTLLPPIARAIFVKDWSASEFVAEFGDHSCLIKEVQDLRRAHNFADQHAISGVTTVLRQHMDISKLKGQLSHLPEGAAAFWQ